MTAELAQLLSQHGINYHNAMDRFGDNEALFVRLAGKFLDDYYKKGIFESDPFARVDQDGVGRLMQMGCDLGRETRPNIKLGICGEHGGDPSSIEFCHRLNLNYVSCSPFRVPIARLAAAQAAIRYPQEQK